MREMNLLPEEHLYQIKQKRKRKKHIIWISIIVSTIVISYLTAYFMEYNMRKETTKIKEQIENLEKISETQIENSINQEVLDYRKNMLKMVENKRVDHHQFISELEKTIPNEITLQSLSYSSNQYINIQGITTKPDEVADFMVNIAKIEGVKNVFLDHMDFENNGSQQENTPDFNINFTYQTEQGGQNNDFK